MTVAKSEREYKLNDQFTVIHYIWVGPPTKIDPKAVAGHDVVGPIEMARNLKANDSNGVEIILKFWCLNDYIAFYAAQFAEAKVRDKIQLCSIEAYLREKPRLEGRTFLNFLSKTNKIFLKISSKQIVCWQRNRKKA